MPRSAKSPTHCATFSANTDSGKCHQILIHNCVINTSKSYQRHYQTLKKNIEPYRPGSRYNGLKIAG